MCKVSSIRCSIYKTLILCEPKHNKNTQTLVKTFETNFGATIQHVGSTSTDAEDFDIIILASEAYSKKLNNEVETWIKTKLPENKKVFLLHTCGRQSRKRSKQIKALIKLQKAKYIGEYHCNGLDTYSFFRILGSRTKEQPKIWDVEKAVDYYNRICIEQFLNENLNDRYNLIVSLADIDDSTSSAEAELMVEKYDKMLEIHKQDEESLLSFHSRKRLDFRYNDLVRRIEDKLDELKDIYWQLQRIKDCYGGRLKHSFRNPKTQVLLKELAKKEKYGYWKYSQSSPNKGYTSENRDVYEDYQHSMRLIEARDKEMMLSFVSAMDLYRCISFGDQITELLFDVNNPRFQEIMDNPAYIQGNSLGEIKTDYLIPIRSFSISEPSTLQLIVDLSDKNRRDAIRTIFISNIYRDKLERISRIDLKFKRSLAFIDFVRKSAFDNVGHLESDGIEFISKNLSSLLLDFKSICEE